jgi:prepilin-type N-terminal cleavage/methylation domain-containing protein
MSIADRLLRVRRAARGYTALEMLIVVAIVGMTTLVIERTISGVTETERLMRAIRSTAERGQRAAYRLRDVVATSRRLYGNDTVGQAYLARLGTSTLPILPGSRLPTFDEVNPLGPDDVGDPRTGNILLFVREGDPAPCVVDAATQKIRLIDTYRFVCVYLSRSTRTVVSGGPPALELVEWRSISFPSYGQVMSIPAGTERTKAVIDLYNRFGHDYLWDSGAAVDSAFYGIDGIGAIAAAPSVLTTIPEDLNVSSGGRFVAGNMAVAYTDVTSKPRAPVFTVEPVATWTSHGFEVKVAGPSGSRRVWIRLTVEKQASQGRVPAQQTTVVTTTRDL